jgi:hypothetical protein
VLALVLALIAPLAAARYLARVQEARPLLAFRGASLWLAANSRPGELVFHAWWDQFPHLFFWNPPRLDACLETHREFRRVFDDGTDVVYRVKYDAGLRPGGAP